MDIYEQAKKMDADYYDPNTGYTYLIQGYNRALCLGLPTCGIGVVDANGTFIGYAKKINSEPASTEQTGHTMTKKPVTFRDWLEDHSFRLESGVTHAPKTVREWFDRHSVFDIMYYPSEKLVYLFTPDGTDEIEIVADLDKKETTPGHEYIRWQADGWGLNVILA